jgi:hypothetical protein
MKRCVFDWIVSQGWFLIPLSSFNSTVDLKLKQCALLMICSDSNCMKVNDWLSNCEFCDLDQHIESPLRTSSYLSTKSFLKSRFSHKSVNLLFTLVIRKDTLTDLCGNWILPNDGTNTSCEISSRSFHCARHRHPTLLRGQGPAPIGS